MRKHLIFLCLLLCAGLLNAEDCCEEIPHCELPSVKEEKQLFSQITSESRRLYNSLDCEGKSRALFLSKRLQNKNLAIQEAAKEMSIRQKDRYPNQKDYSEEVEERAGQDPYRRRFGY